MLRLWVALRGSTVKGKYSGWGRGRGWGDFSLGLDHAAVGGMSFAVSGLVARPLSAVGQCLVARAGT